MIVDQFQWPPSKHITVTVDDDDSGLRIVRYTCSCSEVLQESFQIKKKVQTAREAYQTLQDMYLANIHAVEWTEKQPRTSKEVRESEGHKWRLKHASCNATARLPQPQKDDAPPA